MIRLNSPRRHLATARALLICISAATSFAHAACALPPVPSKIPDGATVSDDEMRVTMSTMARFESDVDSYLKCLVFEQTQGRLSEESETQLRLAALDRHQAVMSRFNAQMRVYMAR